MFFVSDDIRSTAIKASVAAGVTLILISVCIIAEGISRYRVWKRVKKACDKEPLKLDEEKEEKEEMNDDNVKKV